MKAMRLTVTVIRGPAKGRRIESEEACITVGRGEGTVLDLSPDLTVSRKHARIRQADGRVYAEQWEGRRGILVNGSAVVSLEIASGAEVTVGDSVLRVDFPGGPGKASFLGRVSGKTWLKIGVPIVLVALVLALLPGRPSKPSTDPDKNPVSVVEKARALRNEGKVREAMDVVDPLVSADPVAAALFEECVGLARMMDMARQAEEALKIHAALAHWRDVMYGLSARDPLREWVLTNHVQRLQARESEKAGVR